MINHNENKGLVVIFQGQCYLTVRKKKQSRTKRIKRHLLSRHCSVTSSNKFQSVYFYRILNAFYLVYPDKL